MRSLLVIALLSVVGMAHGDEEVGRSSLLVAPAQLLSSETAKDSWTEKESYIDVRSRSKYDASHLPGARHVDVAEWKAGFGDGQDQESWSQRISSVLVEPRSRVVVYDDTFSPNAARVWWILKYWGVEDVRILDGGYKAYVAEGGQATDQPPADGKPVEFTATPHPERYANHTQVLDIAWGNKEVCLIDARSHREISAGHIPSAKHLDWQAMIKVETGKLKSYEELESMLELLRVDGSSKSVTYCQSGGRASVAAFVVEYITGKPAANYYGSWGDWNDRNLPGAIGN